MSITNILTGDVAVVTGAASGNGREMACRFAQQGADVVVADINREPREGGDPTDELIERETSSHSKFVSCDVTDVDDLYDAVDGEAHDDRPDEHRDVFDKFGWKQGSEPTSYEIRGEPLEHVLSPRGLHG